MLYEGKISGDRLVLEYTPMPGSSRPAETREIAFSDFGARVGAVETDWAEENDPPDHSTFYMSVRGEQFGYYVYGLDVKTVGAKAPALKEIPAVSAVIPVDVVEQGNGAVDQFLRSVFNDLADGKNEPHGCKTFALVNPAAVEEIRDEGKYRSIILKAEFNRGPDLPVQTLLPVAEIRKRLGPSGP